MPVATDASSAEAAIPSACAELQGYRYTWNHRRVPDGDHIAWLAYHPAPLEAATTDAPLDRLDLHIAGAGSARVVSFAISPAWGTSDLCGPVWLADRASILIGYHTRGEDSVTDACVDVVPRDGEPRPLLREPGAQVLSIARSRDGGTIAVLLRATYPQRATLVLCGPDGAERTRIDATAWNDRAAAPSPDGTRIAVVTDRGVGVLAASGGEPQLLAEAPEQGFGVALPQWLANGESFVTTQNGDVVHVGLATGVLHRWPAPTLDGTAVAAFVLRGDRIAGAVVTHETDATAIDLLLHAGDAPKRVYADLWWLDLRDGSAVRSSMRDQRLVNWRHLAYVPRLSELMARW